MTAGRTWLAAVLLALAGPVIVLTLLVVDLSANPGPDVLPPAAPHPTQTAPGDVGPEVIRVRSRSVDPSVALPEALLLVAAILCWASPFLAARAWRLQGPGLRRRLTVGLYLLTLLLLTLWQLTLPVLRLTSPGAP